MGPFCGLVREEYLGPGLHIRAATDAKVGPLAWANV